MKSEIKTCLLKDYGTIACKLAFKFAPTIPEYAEKVETLNETAACVYIHSESEDKKAWSINILFITLDIESANFMASKLKVEDFKMPVTDLNVSEQSQL